MIISIIFWKIILSNFDLKITANEKCDFTKFLTKTHEAVLKKINSVLFEKYFVKLIHTFKYWPLVSVRIASNMEIY